MDFNVDCRCFYPPNIYKEFYLQDIYSHGREKTDDLQAKIRKRTVQLSEEIVNKTL